MGKSLNQAGTSDGLMIAVYGLGYVGTSIAATWLRAGAVVEGFDLSAERIANLNNPRSIDFEQAVRKLC